MICSLVFSVPSVPSVVRLLFRFEPEARKDVFKDATRYSPGGVRRSKRSTRLDGAKFVRIHRGAIVNVASVRELRRKDGEMVVVLADGTRIPVSRRRRAALADQLG